MVHHSYTNAMQTVKCRLKNQKIPQGSCRVETDGKVALACQATLKYIDNEPHRLITSVHLSRPENKWIWADAA